MLYRPRNNRKGSAAICTAVLAALSGGAAMAAELEEVLVSARKVSG